MPATLHDKIFESHLVERQADGTCILYVDRHLLEELSSPQAFDALRQAGRRVRAPAATLAVADHNVPTANRAAGISDPESRLQVETLAHNAREFGITFFDMHDARQGILHVIGAEQGFALPGTTIVSGDSHTSTLGAFGALALGLGTSDVERVLATQTLALRQARNMRVKVEGALPQGVSAKDIALSLIGKIGAAGAIGHVIEYAGTTIHGLSMEARMTICNMAVEAGAPGGLVAPDNTTFAYLHGRPMAPRGTDWDQALRYWRGLRSDDDAVFDREVLLDVTRLAPLVTWGTSPEQVVAIDGVVPDPHAVSDPTRRRSIERALAYMDLAPGTQMVDVPLDVVWIGSCANGRIEDLRAAARVVAGRRIATRLASAMVVPGSGLVKQQAEAEGLDKIFLAAGFEWRDAGCSMCLAMNPDRLLPGQRCAATSNRNFEGRQGYGGRTHLVSPAMAAAAAIAGHFVDVRKLG